MKFLKTLVIAIVVIVVAAVVVSLFLPSTVTVERSHTINAPVSKVFSNVASFSHWPEWSPWHQIDTNMTVELSGPESGMGAKQSWSSDHDQVGDGSQEIVEFEENKHIKTHLDFGEQGEAFGSWNFEEDGEGTKVTWSFETDFGMNPIMKFMGLMMEGMIGDSYEKGLSQLDEYTMAQPDAPSMDMSFEDAEPQWYIGSRMTVSPDSIGASLGQMYGMIGAWMGENKVMPAGMPFSLYHTWTEESTDMEAAMPIADSVAVEAEGLFLGKTRGGKYLTAVHTGSYDGLEDAYMTMFAHIEESGMEATMPSIDWYLNDPGEVAPEEVQTKILIPIVEEEMTADASDEAAEE